MLKKIFFIGLGFSIIVVKKSVNFLMEKGQQTEEQIIAVMDVEPGEDKTETVQEPGAPKVTEEIERRTKGTAAKKVGDDLTQINGVGPTYAKRLKDAGITTFAAISECSPEELRSVTKATGKTADTESWIAQAADLL